MCFIHMNMFKSLVNGKPNISMRKSDIVKTCEDGGVSVNLVVYCPGLALIFNHTVGRA